MTIERQWADATRQYRWDEADQLWRKLMAQWLMPTVVDQRYWNNLLDRKMAVLERKEQRSTISDNEFDKIYGDTNQ
jgi:hypothetical protein